MRARSLGGEVWRLYHNIKITIYLVLFPLSLANLNKIMLHVKTVFVSADQDEVGIIRIYVASRSENFPARNDPCRFVILSELLECDTRGSVPTTHYYVTSPAIQYCGDRFGVTKLN